MKTIIALITLMLTLSNSFAASSRIEAVASEDAYDRLQKIVELKTDLDNRKAALTSLEKELATQLEKADKRKTGKLKIAGGIVACAALAGASFYVYKYESETMSDLYTMFLAPLAALPVLTGTYDYFMNANEAEAYLEKVRLAKNAIKQVEENLKKETIQLCKIDARNKLCY